MTTYVWSFPQFEVAKSENGLPDVVKAIHWRYDAVDGDVSASAYSAISLDAPNPGVFVPYAEITEQWAVDNVSSKVDVPALEASLAAQIEQQKNPPTVTEVPPFAA